MKISKKFNVKSVIHDKIHYFPDSFEFTETGVHAEVVYRRNKWYQDTIKITIKLAEEIKQYADNRR